VIVVYKDGTEFKLGACSTFPLRLRLISLKHTLIFRPSTYWDPNDGQGVDCSLRLRASKECNR
jgi:hypothetical protein